MQWCLFVPSNAGSRVCILLTKATSRHNTTLLCGLAGAIDTFNLMLPNLGSISKILIGHDNAGAGAAWHLASVEVVSISSCQSLMFHHNGWLSRSDPPYKTEVELLPVAAGGSNGQGLCRYSIVVYTSDIRGAGAVQQCAA